MLHTHLHISKNITELSFQEEWETAPHIIYPDGLGAVRDLMSLLPEIKRLNLKFFFDSTKPESYESVQILSSLGVYSGIVIHEGADWERLTDLMYYALCGRAPHAPVEPFQYVYDMYQRNLLVDYGKVFREKGEGRKEKEEGAKAESTKGRRREGAKAEGEEGAKQWQRFFYERSECAACEGWRICLGKYASLKDKTPCQTFMIELLEVIESLRFKKFKDLINLKI